MRFLAALLLITGLPGMAAVKKPKLVVALAIDQFRYDYLTRFRSEYSGGLERLLTKGAVFTNARYEHFPTVTAIGHSTFLSGAPPSISGIVGNDWFERETGKDVKSITDDTVKILGGAGEGGASPRRMLVSTLGDELRIASGGKSRVVGISTKDRSAILPAGHMANGAYWFDSKTEGFISSTYYFDDLPGWVKDFNATRPGEKYHNLEWKGKRMTGEALARSPYGNEVIESFAERAVEAEQLGRRDTIDLLAVSFSSNDYVGHDYGPDSPEVHDISVRTDKLLDKFFRFLDSQVGAGNVLVVMTADHGVSPTAEANRARKMPGGRIPRGTIQQTVQARLSAKYGEGKWILSPSDHSLYLNWDLIQGKDLDLSEVQRVAANAILSVPHVFRVYTREHLNLGGALEDAVGRRVMNGFHMRRSADVYILLEPYWIFEGGSKASHGTTYSYDAHVPVIFMGPGVRPGRYHQNVLVNDIAPTLATMLDVETPSGSIGRVLAEMLME